MLRTGSPEEGLIWHGGQPGASWRGRHLRWDLFIPHFRISRAFCFFIQLTGAGAVAERPAGTRDRGTEPAVPASTRPQPAGESSGRAGSPPLSQQHWPLPGHFPRPRSECWSRSHRATMATCTGLHRGHLFFKLFPAANAQGCSSKGLSRHSQGPPANMEQPGTPGPPWDPAPASSPLHHPSTWIRIPALAGVSSVNNLEC